MTVYFLNDPRIEQVISVAEFCDRAISHTEYTFAGYGSETDYQILEFEAGWIYVLADLDDHITEERISSLLANSQIYHETEREASSSAVSYIDDCMFMEQ